MTRQLGTWHGAWHGGPVSAAIWRFARFLVWLFYRVERIGGDLPDGPVLLVANHANGLLDPAVVVATAGRQPRFLAKSTLFTMPLVGWFVRQVGSIPVFRRADTGVDPAKNEEMFRAVRAALAAGDAVCLFPEGISHSSGLLEPLKTGAARIALGAGRDRVAVKVVPVGLNFDDKEVFRSSVVVAFGPPIECAPWVDASRHDEVAAVRAFTAHIAGHLRDVMVEAEPTSDVEVVERVNRVYAAARSAPETPQASLERRRLIARGVATLRSRDPERFAFLFEQLLRYERRRARFGLGERTMLASVAARAAVWFAVREMLWGLLLLPVILLGVLVFFVPYQIVRLAARGIGVSLDQQATIKIAVGIIAFALWVAALVVVAGAWFGSIGMAAAAVGVPLLGLGTLWGLEREGAAYELARGVLSSWLTKDVTESRLIRQRSAFADLLDETHRWLGAPGGEAGARPGRPGPASES